MAQQGEPVRIEELLAQAGWLRALASSLVTDRSTADDVVQETWIAALRHPPRGRVEEQALRSWLARVARNIARNLHRSGLSRIDREAAVREQRSSLSPAHLAEEAEAHKLLSGAVAALEDPFRSVIVLRYIRGHDATEISRLLGVPAGTVRWRLMRALEELRVALDRANAGDRDRWLRALAPIALGPSTWSPPPVSLTSPLAVGGVLLMKKLAVALACLALAGVLWRVWPLATKAAADFEGAAVPLGTSEGSGGVADPQPDFPDASTEERVALESTTSAEEPAASADAFGSIVVQARWGDDGTDAAGVGLILRPIDDPLSARHVSRVATDEHGTARGTRVPVGTMRIEADRGGTLEAEILAGRETRATFDLPLGIDLVGTVTNPIGEPVADAEVLLVAEERDWLATRVVARTNGAGDYRVRAAGEAFAVSARAEEYMPAYLESLRYRESAERPLRVDLMLLPARLALRGIVLDPDHQPVAGAFVAVGDSRGSTLITQDRSMQSFGRPVVETAQDGTFLARGVDQSVASALIGSHVAVMAEGYPIWIGDVPGDLGATSYCEIVLERGATIQGSVRDPDGAPVDGALVVVQEQSDRLARDIPFPLPSTASDLEGNYRLELLAPGSVSIRVDPPQATDFGHGFAQVHLLPGGLVTLNVNLPEDDTIHGRAIDARGLPLAGYDIRWWSQASRRSQRPIQTDVDGRFEIASCNEPPYTLGLLVHGTGQQLTDVQDVGPGPEEVLLVVPERGSVSGSFSDDGHRSPGRPDVPENPVERMRAADSTTTDGISIFLSSRGEENPPRVAYRDGTFLFEPVVPGTYRLTIRTDACMIHRSDWFDLAPGEHLDLGVIRSEAAGSLAVEIPHVEQIASLCGLIRSPDFDVASFLQPSGWEFVASELSPGTWYVDIDAEGMASALEPVEIHAGEQLRIRIDLEPGTARTIVFAAADPSASWSELRSTVKSEDGRTFLATEHHRSDVASPSILVTLPLGTFVVEGITDTGLMARGMLAVPDLGPQVTAIRLQLR